MEGPWPRLVSAWFLQGNEVGSGKEQKDYNNLPISVTDYILEQPAKGPNRPKVEVQIKRNCIPKDCRIGFVERKTRCEEDLSQLRRFDREGICNSGKAANEIHVRSIQRP